MAGNIKEAREDTQATRFLDNLINYALADNKGSARVTVTDYVIRPGVACEEERIVLEAPLRELVTPAKVAGWKNLARRTLSQPEGRNFRGVTVRDTDSGVTSIYPEIPELKNIAQIPSVIKYATVSTDLDQERADNNHFSPDPKQGRIGARLTYQDVTRNSRQQLFGALDQIINEGAKKFTDRKIAEAIYGGTDNMELRDAVGRLESTPITSFSLTFRTTHWDPERRVKQPINLGGVRVSEGLDGVTQIETLKPEKGHKVWERIPLNDEWSFENEYNNVRQTIDTNLLAFSHHLAKG